MLEEVPKIQHRVDAEPGRALGPDHQIDAASFERSGQLERGLVDGRPLSHAALLGARCRALNDRHPNRLSIRDRRCDGAADDGERRQPDDRDGRPALGRAHPDNDACRESDDQHRPTGDPEELCCVSGERVLAHRIAGEAPSEPSERESEANQFHRRPSAGRRHPPEPRSIEVEAMEESCVDGGECRLDENERSECDDRRVYQFAEPWEQEGEEEDPEPPSGEPRLTGTPGFDDRPQEAADRQRRDRAPSPRRIGEHEQQPGQHTENDRLHPGSL